MPLITTWTALIIFWILVIYSVSIYESFQITLKLQHIWTMLEPSNYFYFVRQLKNLAIWLIVAILVYKVPLDFIQNNRNKIFIFALLFLLLVFTPLWVVFNWSRWWLYFSGLWTVQPSEFFKVAFILFLAGWLIKKKTLLIWFQWFIAFLFVTGFFFFIFLMIPDLWTVLVLGLVVLVMYRYIWGKLKYVIGLLVLWMVLGFTVWMQFDYIKKRLDYFVNPDIDEKWRWIWWQIQQALVSIWGGGFWWTGYGKGLQKFWYIPEAQSDFVFAAFSEEMGFIWNSVLLTLYFLLAYFFLKNLHTVRNEYYRVLWVWLISLIIMQVFVNIWVNIRIIPLTWLTLPFISFWGTALMVNLVELSLLYKIMKQGNYSIKSVK